MHIIEIPFTNAPQAEAFLQGLFYSESVSAIGTRYVSPQKTIAVAINYDQDEETELDNKISKMVADQFLSDSGEDFDESEIYLTKVYPETEIYAPERQ